MKKRRSKHTILLEPNTLLSLMRSLSLVLSLLIPAVLSITDVRIHHRIVRGHGQPSDFSLRGTVSVDEATGIAKYTDAEEAKLDIGGDPFHDCCLYELALEKPGAEEKDWSFTSTKAVSLPICVIT